MERRKSQVRKPIISDLERFEDEDTLSFNVRKLHHHIRQEQKKIDVEKQEMFPYTVVLIIIGIIGIFFISRGFFVTSNENQRMIKSFQAESEDCLVKYSQNKCQVSSNSEECQRYLSCLKRTNDGKGFIQFFLSAIFAGLKSMSTEGMGIVMFIICGLILKLILLAKENIRAKVN